MVMVMMIIMIFYNSLDTNYLSCNLPFTIAITIQIYKSD
jgi:hypothetical protein